MASSRQLKNKIKTVGNIKQITYAMQMVAATKMRKAQETALRARPYAKEALSLLQGLTSHEALEGTKHPLFEERKQGRTCLVVVTSDKGLAGSFNAQVLRLASLKLKENKETDIVAVGRKARDYFVSRGITPQAEFLQFSDIVSLHDVRPLTLWILNAFREQEYKNVVVVSTQFVSALVQQAKARQLLPLDLDSLQEAVSSIVPAKGKYAEMKENGKKEEESGHLLEPTPQAIFHTVAESLVEAVMLHYMFESNASEHSSRMVAMKNATENAGSIEEELVLALNKARQASITQELTEISTAKEALTTE